MRQQLELWRRSSVFYSLFHRTPDVYNFSTCVAQNIGGENTTVQKLTLKYVLMITVTYGLIKTIIVQFVSVPLVGLFTNDGAVAVSGRISSQLCVSAF